MNLVKCWGAHASGRGRISNFAISVRAIGFCPFGDRRGQICAKLRLGARHYVKHSPTEPNELSLIFKLESARSTHDWERFDLVADGSSTFRQSERFGALSKAMEGDARRSRTRTYQIALHFVIHQNGVVHESVEEQTESLGEWSGT